MKEVLKLEAIRNDLLSVLSVDSHTTESINITSESQSLSTIRKILVGGHINKIINDIDSLIKINKMNDSINNSNSPAIFHKKKLFLKDNLVFTLMPFSENWSDYIWQEVIRPTVENIPNLNLQCIRADDIYGQDIMQDVYEHIYTSCIVIADITDRNSNVFYELGIAHTLGKEVVLLSQAKEHIPFDLIRFRHCIYSNDGPGYKILQKYIINSINSIFSVSK